MVRGPTPAIKRVNAQRAPKSFLRFGSDMFARMKQSWRMPKGLDNRARRRFKGNILLPQVGYGTNAKTRHLLPNGFYKFRVSNVKELEMLLMHNRKFAAEVAGSVSARVRRDIVKRAAELNIKVTNAGARLRATEAE